MFGCQIIYIEAFFIPAKVLFLHGLFVFYCLYYKTYKNILITAEIVNCIVKRNKKRENVFNIHFGV